MTTSDEGSDFVWVLDPIDGTKSFITGKFLVSYGKPEISEIEFHKVKIFGAIAVVFCSNHAGIIYVHIEVGKFTAGNCFKCREASLWHTHCFDV